MKRLFFYATLFAAATWLAFAELNPPGNDGVGAALDGKVGTNHNGSVTINGGTLTLQNSGTTPARLRFVGHSGALPRLDFYRTNGVYSGSIYSWVDGTHGLLVGSADQLDLLSGENAGYAGRIQIGQSAPSGEYIYFQYEGTGTTNIQGASSHQVGFRGFHYNLTNSTEMTWGLQNQVSNSGTSRFVFVYNPTIVQGYNRKHDMTGLEVLALESNLVTVTPPLLLTNTNNLAPNQTASSAGSLMTRSLADERYGLLVDTTTALLVDDFTGWSGASTGYGRYGWTFAAISGATGGGFDNSRGAYQTGSTLGICAFSSGTSNSPAFYQGSFNNGSGVYPPLLINMAAGCTGWSNSMRVALTTTTNQLVRVGLSNALGGILPNNWMGFEYSAGTTATNWLVHQRNSSSSTIVTSTVAATTSFVTLTMWTTNTGGNVFYDIDGTTVTNLPSQPGTAWPWLAMATTDGVSRSLVLDYWLLLIRGLSR